MLSRGKDHIDLHSFKCQHGPWTPLQVEAAQTTRISMTIDSNRSHGRQHRRWLLYVAPQAAAAPSPRYNHDPPPSFLPFCLFLQCVNHSVSFSLLLLHYIFDYHNGDSLPGAVRSLMSPPSMVSGMAEFYSFSSTQSPALCRQITLSLCIYPPINSCFSATENESY